MTNTVIYEGKRYRVEDDGETKRMVPADPDHSTVLLGSVLIKNGLVKGDKLVALKELTVTSDAYKLDDEGDLEIGGGSYVFANQLYTFKPLSEVIECLSGQPKDSILSTPLPENDAEAKTVGEYLAKLATQVIREGGASVASAPLVTVDGWVIWLNL